MRRRLFFLFFFVLPVLLSLSYYVVYYRLATPVPAPGSFDYLKLSQQWPPAVCRGKPRCPHNFTIHGLWPNKFNGRLEFCDNTTKFNRSEVKPLFPLLKSSWPNLLYPDRDEDFWVGQWKKHGTCSSPPYNQSQYFKLALDLYGRYDILHCFHVNNISSGHTYSFELIHKTIKSLTSKMPNLCCGKSHNVLHDIVLREVHICFNKSVVIDCPRNRYSCSGDKRSCSGNIYFPE